MKEDVGTFVGKAEEKREGVFREVATRWKVVELSSHTVMRRLNPDQKEREMDQNSL